MSGHKIIIILNQCKYIYLDFASDDMTKKKYRARGETRVYRKREAKKKNVDYFLVVKVLANLINEEKYTTRQLFGGPYMLFSH